MLGKKVKITQSMFTPGKKICRKCGNAESLGIKYCTKCGKNAFCLTYDEYIDTTYKYCANCGKPNKLKYNFCPNCGKSKFISYDDYIKKTK